MSEGLRFVEEKVDDSVKLSFVRRGGHLHFPGA